MVTGNMYRRGLGVERDYERMWNKEVPEDGRKCRKRQEYRPRKKGDSTGFKASLAKHSLGGNSTLLLHLLLLLHISSYHVIQKRRKTFARCWQGYRNRIKASPSSPIRFSCQLPSRARNRRPHNNSCKGAIAKRYIRQWHECLLCGRNVPPLEGRSQIRTCFMGRLLLWPRERSAQPVRVPASTATYP